MDSQFPSLRGVGILSKKIFYEYCILLGASIRPTFIGLIPPTLHFCPKRRGVEDISEVRPISLIHSIAKILAKILALRLGPFMQELVSNVQSALIKKRSIHDNFLYVKNMARKLHKGKKPCLLFKLDIRKALDSMRWDYLLDLLKKEASQVGFRIGLPPYLQLPPPEFSSMGLPTLPFCMGAG
jgi:hypothetical protein